MLVERSVGAAAISAGVTPRAVQLWLQQPEFISALADARQRVMTATISGIVGASTVAIRRLHEIVDNPHTDLNVLLDSIKLILNLSLTLSEREQLLKRLAVLEALQGSAPEPWEPSQPLLEAGGR